MSVPVRRPPQPVFRLDRSPSVTGCLVAAVLLTAATARAASPSAADLAPQPDTAFTTEKTTRPAPASAWAPVTAPAESITAATSTIATPDSASPPSERDSGFAPVTQQRSFTIRIEAPDDVRRFVDRYLELKRYEKVSDLDDAELRLLLAESDANIRQLLATQGYFTPDIGQRLDAPAGSAALPEVVIRIDPGPKTIIGAVDIGLAGAVTSYAPAQGQRNRVRQRWSLPVGEVFTQAAWSTAKSEGLRRLQARRFPTARLTDSRAEIDPDTSRARLAVHYDSGPLYRYGPVQIKGAQRYDPLIIQRLARVPAGAEYRQADLLEAQQRLLDSGYYNGAFVSIDTSPETNPEQAPVLVQVQEAKLQKVVAGVGFSTDRGPRVSLDHTHNLVPGLGWRALSRLQFDKKLQAASTSLMSPPNDDLWRWLVSGSYTREQLTDHIQNTQQLRFGRTKLERQLDRTWYLQYDHSKARYTDGWQVNAQAVSANYVWTLRRFNSMTYPTGGYGLGLEAGGGLILTPRQQPFTRFVGRYLGFLSLDGDVRGGLGSALPGRTELKQAVTGERKPADEDSDPLLQAVTPTAVRQRRNGELVLRLDAGGVFTRPDAVIPPNLMFLTGGDTTVRGYGYQEIGVTNARGLLEPGRYMVAGSVEYRRPVFSGGKRTDWDSVVYVDAGSVANTVGSLRPLKVGVGAGALWRSPVGPVQVSLAYGLQSRKLHLHMNLGFSF